MTFPTPRPKGIEQPTKAPRKTNHSHAPMEGNLSVLGLPNQGDERESKKADAIAREVEYELKKSRRYRYRRGALKREQASRNDKSKI